MISENLKNYLKNINTNSKFESNLSERGGYISFSNTSDKVFTLGLDSFISILKDILQNFTKFTGHDSYIEKERRDLSGQYYTDSAANAMATVQTKPLFTTISKIINWANKIEIDSYSDNKIILKKQELEITIIQLEKLAEVFKPKYLTKSNNDSIIENKSLRQIVFESFKYCIKRYGQDIVLKNYDLKETKIENRIFRGLSLDEYFGFETLIGLFDSEQNSDTLKSSGTQRFNNEKINILGNPDSYFTTQWNSVENGRGLTLSNFNLLLKNISNAKLKIIKENDLYKLINSNTSPISKVENIIFYGAPGTGKSYRVDNIIKGLDSIFYERITFHPEFDNSSFLGSYKPKNEKINGIDEIKYKFVPQVFTNIYVRAWNDLDNQYYLAIEEINRGNCAEIFGDIFQLLDRNNNYTISPSQELKEFLEDKFGQEHQGIINGLKLPPNLTILATMNTSDQSLFPMDSAFKRRWDWEYIPICYDDISENESFKYSVIIDESTTFKWVDFIKNVNAKIKANPNLGMDKCIGNYFIKSVNSEITLKEFVNKAIFYLWNDVFKDEDSSESIFEKGISYEDFFPIETNGIEEVKKILKAINVEPKVSQ